MITDHYAAKHPEGQIVTRDLVSEPLPHIDPITTKAIRTPPETHEEAVRAAYPAQRAVLDEFLASDVVVIGAPMYNFSIPSQLKSWIDRIAQAGRTFTYTDKGPKGLAGGKTVIVASTRGGVYSTTDGGRAMEHQESYLQTVFGFLGITDVRFVRAEGLAMGADAKAKAMAAAQVEIEAASSVAANQDQVANAA